MAGRSPVPIIMLVLALVAGALFSRGLRIVDTVGMLVCGALAGGALASMARRR